MTPLSKSYDVLTFGDTCVDLIMSGADVIPEFGQVEKLVGDYSLEMGGSCTIFACQAARLGLRTAVLGRVGADPFGELILQRLAGCGVEIRHIQVDPALKTGLSVSLCLPGDRAILTYLGTINALRPGDVSDELLASTRHLHHGSYYLHTGLRSAIPEIFQRAHRLGATTSLDTNWDPDDRWNGSLSKVLPDVDVFMPNDAEALRIGSVAAGGQAPASLDEAARRFLALGIHVVAVKSGARGARVYSSQEMLERPSAPVSGGDTIGAGDSFDAGFLAGWLRGYPLARCLEIGIACGRAVASRAGGLAGQLDWQEVASI